jgi:hypothetical protein
MKFDKDTLLMVYILLRAFRLEEFEQSELAEYMEVYEHEIKDTGRLFEYLGLAKLDKTSPLGWKPTDQLLEIIEKGPSNEMTRQDFHGDEFMLDLLCDAVFGGDADRGTCPFQVLSCLGLSLKDDYGAQVPTLQLRDLFYDGHYARRRT